MESMDPEERRRRGLRKIAIGVGMLVIVAIITVMLIPRFYG